MTRSDAERVADIVESCRRLGEIVAVGAEEFHASSVLQDAACYRLAVIGEALNHLSAQFAQQHAGLQVPQARGMRNRLTHEYYAIDADVLWNTLTSDIARLRETLASI